MSSRRITEYTVLIDGEFAEGFALLREARRYVEKLPLASSVPSVIKIVKCVTISEVVNEYKPVVKTVLESTKAFDDIDLA